jgi:mRNA interferase HigB
MLGTTDKVVMRVIAKKALRGFWEKVPEAEAPLAAWHKLASKATWGSFSDLKETFGSADMVKGNKVIFDVGGNKYRIVALVAFRTKRLFILFVGTHKEYDKIQVEKL